MTDAYKVGAGAGHVTAGGSICIEALTLSGTARSWTSQYNVESILNIVMLNMIGEIGPYSCLSHRFWMQLCSLLTYMSSDRSLI